jgi:hypothetical protein
MFLQTASLRSDNCSPSPGHLFGIVRNDCSASFGIIVRHHRNTQHNKKKKDRAISDPASVDDCGIELFE